MIGQFTKGRVAVFIDAANILYSQKTLGFGFIVKSKPVKRIALGNNTYEWKGNLDVELTIDVLKHLSDFDTFILMSGDSDFAAVIDEVKKAGKRVIVISTKGHVARELIIRAKYINLKKLREKIEFSEKQIPPPKRGEV